MSITLDMEAAQQQLDDDRRIVMENAMTDFYLLYEALDQCTTPNQVLEYLVVEIESRNRQSYIDRIYGRYRKMLPTFDRQVFSTWRDTHGKSRKAS